MTKSYAEGEAFFVAAGDEEFLPRTRDEYFDTDPRPTVHIIHQTPEHDHVEISVRGTEMFLDVDAMDMLCRRWKQYRRKCRKEAENAA